MVTVVASPVPSGRFSTVPTGSARRSSGDELPRVVAVVGPTAAGKSDLGVALARALGGEVVNADSMQLYRGMDVGTAKLAEAERGGVTHHLLDVWDVRTTATAAAYQSLARTAIDDVLGRGVEVLDPPPVPQSVSGRDVQVLQLEVVVPVVGLPQLLLRL